MVSTWPWFVLALGLVCHLSTSETYLSSRKERFLLSVLKFHNSRCSVGGTGGVQYSEGICQHKAECRYHKGKILGSCGIFGTCCAVERTCNEVNALQVSFFVPPTSFQDLCTLKVEVSNNKVCQIRLDFEQFSIAQPTNPTDLSSGSSAITNPAYKCLNDSFTVTSPLSTNKLPVLCGENAGQHMYVPVNTSTGLNAIYLSFKLADRNVFPSLSSPTWRVKVSQIECSGTVDEQSLIPSSIHSHANHQHWNLRLPVNDYLRIAPQGCLQYFTERSGIYETFNYNSGNGPYIGNLNYAICFKRYPDVCAVRHTASKFVLACNPFSGSVTCQPGNEYTDSDCDSTTTTTLPSQDYLYVPEGITSLDQTKASKFCGQTLSTTNNVTSFAPGPLSVFFRSDNMAQDGIPEQGFQVKYLMVNSGC